MLFKQAALLIPLLGAALALDPIGYGQQIQNSDETNHWVVWYEGLDACPYTRTLGRLVDSPCGQEFKMDGVTYEFDVCDGNHEPKEIVSGKDRGNCGLHKNKINCHDGLHDIVKHGQCNW